MFLKVTDGLLASLKLDATATPEIVAASILDLRTQLDKSRTMNDELKAQLEALTKRIEALESKPAPQVIDSAKIIEDAKAAAKVAASEMISASIAKAGVTTAPAVSDAPTEDKKEPDVVEQYKAMTPGTARDEFRRAHPELFDMLPMFPAKKN